MAERPYVAGAVAIGLVAAALHLTTPSGPPAPPRNAASSPGTHGRPASAGSRGTLDQVYWSSEFKDHPESLGKLTAQTELQETIEDFQSSTAASASGGMEVMIAIEPDPLHTHLSLLFDRDLDALEDALQESGFDYKTNWLPWSPASSEAASGERFADQERERLFLRGREAYPGVLLFRPDLRTPDTAPTGSQMAAGGKALAVFVVGNSPTAGIDRNQFEEALAQVGRLAPGQKELRILGPTFTGSGPSLRTLLSSKAMADAHLAKVTIASGSVTDSWCADLLPAGMIDKDGQCISGTGPPASFVSFGIDRDWRTDQIEAFLKNRGSFAPGQIAELSEDESSYGSGNGRETKVQNGYLHLHFPRNISHLRSAYQNSNIFGFGVSAPGSSSVSLNLDLNEASDDDDAIPNFAEQQMPVSQDGIMHKITEVLERQRIKVVILSATDVLDEVFVADILAREAPNTLVFIDQADNLFLHAASPNNFVNMYFVSPWPLISDSQATRHAEKEPNTSRIFPSDLAQGLFAAVEFLYPPVGRPVHIPDYSIPFGPTHRPPLWLSAEGHGDYWPVALLDDTKSLRRSPFHLPELRTQAPEPESFLTEAPPLSQELLLFLLCAIALYHSVKCFGPAVLRHHISRYTINDAQGRTPKLCLQLVLTCLLLASLQLCVHPYRAAQQFHQPTLALWVFYVTVTVLCMAAAYLLCNLAERDKKQVAPLLFVSALAALGTAVCIFLTWPWVWGRLSAASGFADFFVFRAGHPLAGVSPLFPLFLCLSGFCILIYGHLDRIAFTDNVRPPLPGPDSIPHCPREQDLYGVRSLLDWPPRPRTLRNKGLLLALLGGLVYLGIRALHLEPRVFDGASLQITIDVLMFLLVVLIVWELFMATLLWQRLKTLCLEPLESSSLRSGFNSIRGLTWSSLWIVRGSLSERYRIINRLMEQASREVLQPETRPDETLPKADKDMETTLTELRNGIASEKDPETIAVTFGVLQQHIGLTAGRLLLTLQSIWKNEKQCITACDQKEEEGQTGSCAPAKADKPADCLRQLREEWVALVYIHYCRMVLLQVRSRLVTAAPLYVFLVWAATCYPYLNHHALLLALSALLGLLLFVVIYIYASINRDPVLSRATNHAPGRFDLDFFIKTASLVGVPLLGFVASQFPEVSSFLFSWIEPGMAAVR